MECECHEWFFGVIGAVCGLLFAWIAMMVSAAKWDDEEES